MVVNSTVLIALVILIGATVPSFAEEEPNLPQTAVMSHQRFLIHLSEYR